MRFFRSEEDLQKWLINNNLQGGSRLSVNQLWQLAQKWYHNRLNPNYHGRSMPEIQQIFKEVGLDSEFWQE